MRERFTWPACPLLYLTAIIAELKKSNKLFYRQHAPVFVTQTKVIATTYLQKPNNFFMQEFNPV